MAHGGAGNGPVPVAFTGREKDDVADRDTAFGLAFDLNDAFTVPDQISACASDHSAHGLVGSMAQSFDLGSKKRILFLGRTGTGFRDMSTISFYPC